MDTDNTQATQGDALSSFNSWGVVTLSDGQRVNVQMTNRHGLSVEEMYKDFNRFVTFLDLCAVDHAVRFWEGKGSEQTTGKAEIKADDNVETEPERKELDDDGNEVLSFSAGKLTVEYKSGKPYFQLTDANQKASKYPVRVWPEVLEGAGIKETDVDIKEGKSMTGWTAVYETKDGTKWPAKVTALLKPSFA